MIFDFHAHFTLKPNNSITIFSNKAFPPDDEIVRERFRPKENISSLVNVLAKDLNTTSQLHMESITKSGMRCMGASLYPLEKVFTQFKTIPALIRFLTLILGRAPILSEIGPLALRVIATMTGLEVEQLKRLKKGEYNYFEELLREMDYLESMQNKPSVSPEAIAFEIANDFSDITRIIGEDKLALIITVEGINVFFGRSGNFNRFKRAEAKGEVAEIIGTLTRNITHFKENSPLFIATLAHHQYNFICGHAESFVSIAKTLLNQGGFTTEEGSDDRLHFFSVGIRSWGVPIIDLLLDKTVGNGRVLIDTKHMSRQARIDYHQYVREKRAAGDPIPIIQTHTAVSGRSFDEARRKRNKREELRSRFKNRIPFNAASINLFDEEIIDIIESDGLMGIMLDEKRLLGKKLPKDTEILCEALPFNEQLISRDPGNKAIELAENKRPINRFKYTKDLFKNASVEWIKIKRELAELEAKRIKNGENPPARKLERLQRQEAECRLEVEKLQARLRMPELSILFNQFFYILRIAEQFGEKAWNHICIGSDYDGVINPQDIFYYAENLSGLADSMEKFWDLMLQRQEPEFDHYQKNLFNKPAAHWIQKILWDNSQDFLKKYFNDAYRKSNPVA